MTMQTDLQAAVDKAASASAKLHAVVHGDASSSVETEAGPIKTLARTIADNQAAIAGSRAELDQKVDDAANSASVAEDSQALADQACTAAELARAGAEAALTTAFLAEEGARLAQTVSEAARDSASSSANRAAASEAASSASEAGAANSVSAAASSEVNAAASAETATIKAAEAATHATAAAGSASAAAASAAEVSGSAASMNLPTSVGQAGLYLRQKTDETGLEYAEVDLASRIAKSGDTMTGALTGTTFKTNGTSATSTGFKVASGADIGSLFAAAGNAFTAASGSGSGWGNIPGITSVSLSRSGTTAVLSVGTACNCNCDCNCDGACFPFDTLVSMADGSLVPIGMLRKGDRVATLRGEAAVLGMHTPLLGPRTLWRINGKLFTTGDHLFLMEDCGWAAVEPSLYRVLRLSQELILGDRRLPLASMGNAGHLTAGMVFIGGEEVRSVEPHPAPANATLYCPILLRVDHFILADGIVADAIASMEQF